MDGFNISTLPNPETPLAFLPPALAYAQSVNIYTQVGSLAILCWEILDNLPGDYRLLFKTKISIPTLTYFTAWVSILVYQVAGTIFETAPTGHCVLIDFITDAFLPVAMGASGLLFFFRVRAIYEGNLWVSLFFFLAWVPVLATNIAVAATVSGGNLGPTSYCEDATAPKFVTSPFICLAIYDTLVFLAITYKMTMNAHVENLDVKRGLNTAIRGKYLPSFSRALLKDGQVYYLITVVSNLLMVIMIYTPSIPPGYAGMVSSPNGILIPIMACRVFRNTRRKAMGTKQISTDNMMTTKARAAAATGPSLPVFYNTTEVSMERSMNESNSLATSLRRDSGEIKVVDEFKVTEV